MGAVTLTGSQITAKSLAHLREGDAVVITFKDDSRLSGCLVRKTGNEDSFFVGPFCIFYRTLDQPESVELGWTFEANATKITLPAPPRADGWYQLCRGKYHVLAYRYMGGEWVNKFGDRTSGTELLAELEDKATWIGPIR